jgi:hypothetical protein
MHLAQEFVTVSISPRLKANKFSYIYSTRIQGPITIYNIKENKFDIDFLCPVFSSDADPDDFRPDLDYISIL